MVVRAPDLGGCLCGDCLGPGLLRNGRVGPPTEVDPKNDPTEVVLAALASHPSQRTPEIPSHERNKGNGFGGPGYATPSGNFTASSMNEVWYSKQWDNAPMPNSIFFTKEGHAIHGSYETKKLGRAVSHGCVRLAPENAKTLYALVEEQGLGNTKVVLTGVTPGGEAKVASQARSQNRNRQAGKAWYDPRDYYYPPRPQRRGLFGRRWFFGDPYYDGPQGYYRSPGYYPPRGYRRYAEP